MKHGASHSYEETRHTSRPLSIQWMSEKLIQETIDTWSKAYCRPISEDEAIEILNNVHRFVETLLRCDLVKQDLDHPPS